MIYPNISYDEYAEKDGWTSTNLRTIAQGKPMSSLNLPVDETDAMKLGRLVHTLLLEPENLTEEFVKGPEGDWRGKEKKGIIEVLKLRYPAATVIKPKMFDAGVNMAEMAKTRAGYILDHLTETEISLDWEGFKCRVDAITDTGLIEVKTTGDARFFKWMRMLRDSEYLVQLAHHDQGLMNNGYRQDFDWTHIVIENKPPYEVQVFDYNSEVQARATEKWVEATTVLATQSLGDGYPGGVLEVVPEDIW